MADNAPKALFFLGVDSAFGAVVSWLLTLA